MGAAFCFDLDRLGVFGAPFGGAFLAFLTGMMCGNDYSRGDPARCRRMIRGVRHDQ